MFFAKKSEDKMILILDIQSSVVSGSLVILSEGIAPKVIFTRDINVACQSKMDKSYLKRAVIRSLKEVLQSVTLYIHARRHAEGLPKIPRKITATDFVLSSPWIISEAKTLSVQFEKDTEITKEYICELIDKDQSKMASAISGELKVVEKKIHDVKLNGYSVSDWQEKRAHSLDVSFTLSIASAEIIQSFIDECKHLVKPRNIYFHSSLLLQYIGIEKATESKVNYWLVHIHGDQTDLSFIKNRSCEFFGSYPSGIRTVMEKVERLTGNRKQAVDSLLTLYTGGRLDDSHNKKNIEVVEKVIGEWIDDLFVLLSSSNFKVDPSIPIIISSAVHEDCFAKVLKKSHPEMLTSFISMNDLEDNVVFSEQSEKKKLTALYAVAIHSLFA